MGLNSCLPTDDAFFPGVLAAGPSTDRNDSGCDSRYRSIISELDALIEAWRLLPERARRLSLDRLLRVMGDHIGAENDSMAMVGYPEALLHLVQHHAICVSAAELCHQVSRDRYPVLGELIELRSRWLEHIRVHDRAFEEFLTSWR